MRLHTGTPELDRIDELLNDEQLMDNATNEYGVSFFIKDNNGGIGNGLLNDDDPITF